jgi:uncharacterized protein (TIRG00374 family)
MKLKRAILNILKYLAFLGLGVFLVWWSLHQIPDDKWSDFKAAFATARYWLIIPVFIILTTSHLLRAVRWKMLMKPMGYNPKLSNTFFAVMIGYLANLAIPRLGEVLKCTLLAKYEHVPADKLVGTIVAERALDLVSLLIVFIFAFALQYNIIAEYGYAFVKQLFISKQGHFSPVKILVALTVIALIIFVIRLVLKNFAHNTIIIGIKKVLKGIAEGILSVRHIKNKVPFLFASAGIWLMYLAGTWIGFYATVGTTGLGPAVAVSALAFASVGMIITPGGIGAYAILLAQVLALNGIPQEIGLANGTLQWFAQLIIVVVVGFISLVLLPYFNKKHKKVAQA